MMRLRRTTFVVPDAARAARFYREVFGFGIWYDNELAVDARFPPAAPDGARAHLVILKAEDPAIGMLGFLQYLEAPFDAGLPAGRTRIRMGETILVIESDDLDGVHARAVAGGARVVTPPVNWEVPSNDGQDVFRLRSLSMFDPNGIYLEVNMRR